MKFLRTEYDITKDYAARLNERRATFASVTGVVHGLIDTFITPMGLKRGVHSANIVSQLTSKDLFSVVS